MKVLKFLGLFVLVATMFGCVAAAPPIQIPETMQPIDVTSKDFAQFGVARIRNDMAPGTIVGAHYDGLVKMKVMDYYATGLLSSQAMERYKETVLEELSNCGYKVADRSSLFRAEESYASRFLVGGKLINGTFQSFGSLAGNYTEVFLEIEWQVFDNATAKVIHKAVTSGYAKVDGVSLEADYSAFRDCFRNFLADRELVAAIEKSTIASETPKEILIVAHHSRNPAIDKSPNKIDMIKKGVFTTKIEGRHGSGFVINPEGYGITNYHVIGERKVFDAIFPDGKTIRAKVVRTIPEKDLAVVKLTGEDYFYLPLGTLDRVSMGKEVYAIGSPVSLGLSHSISRGIISAIRELEPVTLVQTDASISPGSSGGPLIDPNGLVLGVITVKVSQFGVEGIGFAVSSNDIIEALKTPPSPKRKREEKEEAKKETIEEERVAKKTVPPAAFINKVVIGVLDIEISGTWSTKGHKKALMEELRRNTTVKLVDIHEANSLSDLKRHGYLLAEKYEKQYQLDMILQISCMTPYHFRRDDWNYYFSLIDLYTKKVKEVRIDIKQVPDERKFRGRLSKVLVSEDLNRVLRAKRKAAGK